MKKNLYNDLPITAPAYPLEAKCPVCGKKLDGNFFVWNAGAMIIKDGNTVLYDSKNGEIEGFSYITAHLDRDRIYVHKDIFKDVTGGQVEIYTCSGECMKTIFSKIVDILMEEVLIKKQQNL